MTTPITIENADRDAINLLTAVRNQLPHSGPGDQGAVILGAAILYLMHGCKNPCPSCGATGHMLQRNWMRLMCTNPWHDADYVPVGYVGVSIPSQRAK